MTTPPTLESRLARVEQVIAALTREVAAIRAELGNAPRARTSRRRDAPCRRSGRSVAHAGRAASASDDRADARARPRSPHPRETQLDGLRATARALRHARHRRVRRRRRGRHVPQLGHQSRLLAARTRGARAARTRVRRGDRRVGHQAPPHRALVRLEPARARAGHRARVRVRRGSVVQSRSDVGRVRRVGRGGVGTRDLRAEPGRRAALVRRVRRRGDRAVRDERRQRQPLRAARVRSRPAALRRASRSATASWPVAWQVFYLSSALFVGEPALDRRRHGTNGFYATFALPLVVGAAGILPFAPDARKRAALRWLALLALLATRRRAASVRRARCGSASRRCLLAVALWLFIIDRLRGVEQSSLLASNADRSALLDWIDGAAIPLALTLRAASVVPSGHVDGDRLRRRAGRCFSSSRGGIRSARRATPRHSR